MRIEPEIQALLERVRQAGRPPYWQSDPVELRSRPGLMQMLFGEAPADVHTEEIRFPTSDGSMIGARLHKPNKSPKGLIVFFHGGGWVVGSVAGYNAFTCSLARRTGCVVMSVEYRLAPEHPFPLPVQDASAAVAYAARHASQWLATPDPVLMVMGESAGSALATTAARLHNQGDAQPKVCLQVLVYPVCAANFDTPSYEEFDEGYLVTRRDMQWFWDQYCPDHALREHPDCAPLRATDLAEMPPALILTAGLDPLRDEGEAYGQVLARAGVHTDVIRCEGLPHGFLGMANISPSAGKAYNRIVSALCEAGLSLCGTAKTDDPPCR